MTTQYNASLMETLEQLDTPQLEAMLQSELEKEQPDEQSVRLILKVLWKRERDFPVFHNERIDNAWEKYKKQTRPISARFTQPLIKVAAVLVLCSLFLFALPQEANAASIFDRIAAWSESIFGLFDHRDDAGAQGEYVFRTEHPGLQELYDTVTELGVTAPVVPMWLDLDYELIRNKVTTTPTTTKVRTTFGDGNREAVFEFNVYTGNIPREFHKDQSETIAYEYNETCHYIFHNRNVWTVVWTKDNLECFLTIDCPEYSLYRIIDSIYTMGEQP